jgi:hypothetical protein
MCVQSRQRGILTEEPASVSINAGERETQLPVGRQDMPGEITRANGRCGRAGARGCLSEQAAGSCKAGSLELVEGDGTKKVPNRQQSDECAGFGDS